jgi:hypothetical protein
MTSDGAAVPMYYKMYYKRNHSTSLFAPQSHLIRQYRKLSDWFCGSAPPLGVRTLVADRCAPWHPGTPNRRPPAVVTESSFKIRQAPQLTEHSSKQAFVEFIFREPHIGQAVAVGLQRAALSWSYYSKAVAMS